MNSDVNELAQAVLKKPLMECSIEELLQIAEQYPYFGPVQLLLAKKISDSSPDAAQNSNQYDEQVQKASLYFQNRVWLDHLLDNNGNTHIERESETERETERERETEQEIHHVEVPINRQTESEWEKDEVKTNEPANDEPVEDEPGDVEPVADTSEIIEQALIHESKAETLEPATDQSTTIDQSNSPIEMPPMNFESATAATSLVFEPYHTVDYFASQGIRFREDEKPKDRFGIQLKSFTEWLKTLKQVNTGEIVSAVDTTADKKVEQMAEFSLAERHVITEAMAEVWIKQGNKAKAEEIYRKLSLLDPPKSSYFAAKIEELKKTN